MPLFRKGLLFILFLALIWVDLQQSSCAVVKAPTGGPKDTIPPVVFGSIPKNFTRNFKGNSITILFNEYIKIKDPNTSVQISPELEKPPLIHVVNKNIEILFKKPLSPNRTYSINFGNSIVDYNEGNVLKNYRYILSTGPNLDSLKIKGTVSDPLDTAVKKDVYVIIHPTGDDSSIIKKKPFLFTTTDDKGNFSLENLPKGSFNLYALQETNRNKRFDSKLESIAFLSKPIILTKDTSGIQLNLFRERDTILKTLKKTIRNGLFKAIFTIPNDSLTITPRNIIKEKDYIIENKGQRDSLYIWLTDPKQDSLSIKVQYHKNKPIIVSQLNFNKPKSLPPFTTEDNIKQETLKPNETLSITFSRPVKNLDPSKIIIVEDTTKFSADSIVQTDNSFRHYLVYYRWSLKKHYKLQIKEASILDIFQAKNLAYDHSFVLGEEKNYGSIHLKLTIPMPGNYVVILMDEHFLPLRTDIITKNQVLNYRFLPPGKYRFRIIYDTNKNGKYDTGDLIRKIQPERIVNSKEITIRSNFEINPSFPIPN